MTMTDDNPYLDGNFAPVTEEVTAFDLEVTGTIPEGPRRAPPAQRPQPPPPAEDPATLPLVHSATGMVHGLRLRDGRAEWYRNRWVRVTTASGPTPT